MDQRKTIFSECHFKAGIQSGYIYRIQTKPKIANILKSHNPITTTIYNKLHTSSCYDVPCDFGTLL